MCESCGWDNVELCAGSVLGACIDVGDVCHVCLYLVRGLM